MGCWKRIAVLSLIIMYSLTTSTFGQTNDSTSPLYAAAPSSIVDVRVVESSESAMSVSFNLDQLERERIQDGDITYERFNFMSEAPAGLEGWFELPAVVRHVLIPPRSGVELKVDHIGSRTETNVHIYPRQPVDKQNVMNNSILTASINTGEKLLRDNNSLEHDGLWPEKTVFIGEPAIMRGYRIIPIVYYPLQYNPRTGELVVNESLDIELDFTSDQNRVNLVDESLKRTPSTAVDNMIADLVINPPRRDPAEGAAPKKGSIAYVIGVGNSWNNILTELQPLIDWRRQMGWTVDVIRVQNANNNAAVKDAIREAYEEWEVTPEHVVLVGDPHPQSQYIVALWDARVQGGYLYETDHRYAELEGEDVLPELSVGRFVVDSPQRARDIVQKTVQYEKTPYIGEGDDAGWQKRAAVMAVNGTTGISSIDMCRWVKDVLTTNGYNQFTEVYYGIGNPDPAPCRQPLINSINAGLSIISFRGHLYMNDFLVPDIANLNNGRKLPFITAITCNTNDYGEDEPFQKPFAEHFSKVAGKGAIGATGCSGSTSTGYNNIYSSTVIHALFAQNLYTQGWAHSAGLMGIYKNYAAHDIWEIPENRGIAAWLCHILIINLMGDPAVDLFTDVPRVLVVEDPENLNVGDSRVVVRVTYEDNEEPAPNVQVCLFKDEGFQYVTTTDANGHAYFAINPADMEAEDEVFFTATGHNLMTYQRVYEIGEAEALFAASAFTISDDNAGESRGDGDGIANPTERLELALDIKNFGTSEPEDGITVSLKPHSRLVTVVDTMLAAENAPAPGQVRRFNYIVNIGGGFPNGHSALFDVIVDIGEDSWSSAIEIPIEAPQLEIIELDWENAELSRANAANLRIVVQNIGPKDAPELDAELISFTNTVDTPGRNSSFQPIESDETGTSAGLFTLSANPFHLNGSVAEIALILTSENGLVDTAFYDFIVSQPAESEAFGPDAYGYICVDDTDEDWFVRPEFDWIEISEVGENTGLTDNGQGGGGDPGIGGGDRSIVMDLPFNFQYYGVDFGRVTICSNGWIAMGEHNLFTARNRRIPGGMVCPGMIAPFWDDMIIANQNSGVYTYFDEEEHLFIVEWMNVKKLSNNNIVETFQVILYDPDHHPSFTGDGDIQFQYLDVNDPRDAEFWDTPYSTVGIGSPDMRTGIEYTYWNDRHPGAAPLEDERAIKFTTMKSFAVGSMDGYVMELADLEQPIEGVQILASFGYSAVTDQNGYFFINDVLVPAELDTTYTVNASKQFWNDSTQTDIDVMEGETTRVNFAMRRPIWEAADTTIRIELQQNSDYDGRVTIHNTGDGWLDYESKYVYRGEQDLEQFDLYQFVNVTRHQVQNENGEFQPIGNSSINGVIYLDSIFVVSGGGDTQDSMYAQFYRFTHDGEFIDSVAQPFIDNNGIRDMVYDADFVYGFFKRPRFEGQSYDPFFYRFTHELELVDSINYDEVADDIRSIAYDPVDSVFYMAELRGDIYKVDYDGNLIAELPFDWGLDSPRPYGMAWYPDQPDSLKLLIYHHVANFLPYLSGYNPETGEQRVLTELWLDASDKPLGIDVTPTWNPSVWALVTGIGNAPVGDGFAVWLLDMNTTWIDYNPKLGHLEPDEDVNIEIMINPLDRPDGEYSINIQFITTAAPGFYDIPVVLTVNAESFIDDDKVTTPAVFELQQNYPNPFNPATTIRYSLERAGAVKLTIWDINGRLVDTLVDGDFKGAGYHSVNFEAQKLPNGLYFYKLESGTNATTRKMVLLK